ncbi:MAG: calycin-like domain-containing protein [Candidatus Cryptobacteroides sp.]
MMRKFFALAAFAAMILSGCDTIEKLKKTGDEEYVGTMTVVYQGADVPSDDVKIDVVYEIDGTLTLKFNKVKFVPQMPVSLDINVSGVHYSMKDGNVSFSGTGIVPTYGLVNTEMPDYTVTDLVGTIVDNTLDFSLKFGSVPTSYTGYKLLSE